MGGEGWRGGHGTGLSEQVLWIWDRGYVVLISGKGRGQGSLFQDNQVLMSCKVL